MQQRSVLGNVLKNIFTKYPVTSKKNANIKSSHCLLLWMAVEAHNYTDFLCSSTQEIYLIQFSTALKRRYLFN